MGTAAGPHRRDRGTAACERCQARLLHSSAQKVQVDLSAQLLVMTQLLIFSAARSPMLPLLILELMWLLLLRGS